MRGSSASQIATRASLLAGPKWASPWPPTPMRAVFSFPFAAYERTPAEPLKIMSPAPAAVRLRNRRRFIRFSMAEARPFPRFPFQARVRIERNPRQEKRLC